MREKKSKCVSCLNLSKEIKQSRNYYKTARLAYVKCISETLNLFFAQKQRTV